MRKSSDHRYRIAISAFVLFGIASCARADQVGIDKVRLIESGDGSYLLEVDTTPRFIGAYRTPVFPSRFELIKAQRDVRPGIVVLSYQFDTSGEGLRGEDELVLPWGRAGAALTAQWSDGSIHQSLFLRDFEGIRVPIAMLKKVPPNKWQTAKDDWLAGLRHAYLGWSHWLIVIAVGVFPAGRWRIGLIAFFSAGQALSLVLAELGGTVVPASVSEACILLTVILLAREASIDAKCSQRFAPVMLIIGLLHGLATAALITKSGVVRTTMVSSLLMFNLGVDAFQLTSTCIIAGAARIASSYPYFEPPSPRVSSI